MHIENIFGLDELMVGKVLVFVSKRSPEPRWYRISAILKRYRWEREDGVGGGDYLELKELHPDGDRVLVRHPQYIVTAASWHVLNEGFPEVDGAKKIGEPEGPPRVEIKSQRKDQRGRSPAPSAPSRLPF